MKKVFVFSLPYAERHKVISYVFFLRLLATSSTGKKDGRTETEERKRSLKKISMESLILAQDERWRHA